MANISKIDPMIVSIVERRLTNVCEEIHTRVINASHNPCTSQARDLGNSLLDDKGRLVAYGRCRDGHASGSPVALKNILDYIGRDNIYPEDFIIANDPYIVRFGHLPDWSLVRPVFYKGELMFYNYMRVHQYDVGGAHHAAYFPRCFDIHGEGIIIPPTKIINRGKVNEEIYALILKNVRGSSIVRMDNMLANAAMKNAEKRLIEICDEYGKDVVKAAIDESIRLTEELVRGEIAKWPAGEYTSRTASDCDGTTRDPVWVELKLTIEPKTGQVILDFSNNPRQVDFINTTRGMMWPHTIIPLRWSLPPGLPRNQGIYNCITIKSKEGTVFDPVYPATCGGQGPCLGAQIIELIQLALAQAIPTKVPAGWTRDVNPLPCGRYSNTIDPRTGVPKYYCIISFLSAGSSGAIWGYDAWETQGTPESAGGGTRASTEVMEALYPWQWPKCEFITDSSGDGQFRGSMGIHCEYICEHPQDEYKRGSIEITTGTTNGETFPPFGLLGGGDGARLRMWLERNGRKTKIHSMDIVPVEPGDFFATECGGGGGVGHPLDRDADKVAWDALNEYISLKKARDVYGVVIEPETFKIDYQATEKLRKTKRRAKSYRERFVPSSS